MVIRRERERDICFLFEAADTGTGDVKIQVPVAQVYSDRVCVLWGKLYCKITLNSAQSFREVESYYPSTEQVRVSVADKIT